MFLVFSKCRAFLTPALLAMSFQRITRIRVHRSVESKVTPRSGQNGKQATGWRVDGLAMKRECEVRNCVEGVSKGKRVLLLAPSEETGTRKVGTSCVDSNSTYPYSHVRLISGKPWKEFADGCCAKGK